MYEVDYRGDIKHQDNKSVVLEVRLLRLLSKDELAIHGIYVLTSGEHKISKGKVWASGSATVRASGSATVRAYGSATVEASDSATVNKYRSTVKTELKSNAIVIDRSNKNIVVRHSKDAAVTLEASS